MFEKNEGWFMCISAVSCIFVISFQINKDNAGSEELETIYSVTENLDLNKLF